MSLKQKTRAAQEQAWKTHELAQALDVLRDALPASYPENACVMTKRAINGLEAVISQMIDMTERTAALVDYIDGELTRNKEDRPDG